MIFTRTCVYDKIYEKKCSILLLNLKTKTNTMLTDSGCQVYSPSCEALSKASSASFCMAAYSDFRHSNIGANPSTSLIADLV